VVVKILGLPYILLWCQNPIDKAHPNPFVALPQFLEDWLKSRH